MDIADKIVLWKNKKGYTTNKLAKLAGIAQSTLRDIEIKKNSPSWDTIEKLCSALNITTVQLVSTSEDIPGEQTYDEKINSLPEQAKKIIDTVIEVNQPDKEQAAAVGK